MMKEKWLIFISLLLITLGAAFCYLIVRQDNTGRFDTVSVNRIVKYAEENWGAFAAIDSTGLAYPFSVLDADHTLIFQSEADTAASINEAVQYQNLIMDVHKGRQYLGKGLINTRQQAAMREQLNQISVIIFLAFTMLAFIMFVCFYYLNQKFLKPFKKMKAFAANIAAGNLDIPHKKDGSGIGLYLCSYLMEQMGGSIRCYNYETGFAVELLLKLS